MAWIESLLAEESLDSASFKETIIAMSFMVQMVETMRGNLEIGQILISQIMMP